MRISFSLLLLLVVIPGCPGDSNVGADSGAGTDGTTGIDAGDDAATDASVPGEVILAFDFTNGEQGWQAGFADYPEGQEEFNELDSGIMDLPPELGVNGTGFMIQGFNHPDDLFMFLKRALTAADGLEPNQTYTVTFKLLFASNAPSGCFGVGGAPGEDVFLKAGGVAQEPQIVLQAGFHRMNVDKGDQIVGGPAASVVGNIANGEACEGLNASYVSLSKTHVHEPDVTTTDSGELWLLVGTDSGYESMTRLYYQRIEVTLTPVQ